jgi:RNA polymerase sigma-70 factor (ECF subfamily)
VPARTPLAPAGRPVAAAGTAPSDGGAGHAPSGARDARLAADLVAELPRLTRLGFRLARDPSLAEDLVQEAALRAWARRDQLRPGAPVGPWLNRILVNLVIDRSRARRDEVTVDGIEDRWRDDDYTVDPEQVLARADRREDLEDALARLPAGYRTVVVLHDAAGMTTAAIADAIGISLPAAKQRLRRGRMMLVSALADDDPRRMASLSQPMRCWKARRRISAYLDDELEPDGRRAIEDHLSSCPTCPPLYASLVGLQHVLGGLRDPDTVIPETIAARIAASLGREPG